MEKHCKELIQKNVCGESVKCCVNMPRCAVWQNSSFPYRRYLQRFSSVLHNVPSHLKNQLLIFIFPRCFCRSGNNGRIKNVFFSPLVHGTSVFSFFSYNLFSCSSKKLTEWKILKSMKIYDEGATRARSQHTILGRSRSVRGHWGSPSPRHWACHWNGN